MSVKDGISEARQISHSQNYLINADFVDKLIDKSNINNDDLVVEIGPGLGIVTKSLSKVARKVVAVELDHNLALKLLVDLNNSDNVEIVESDFMNWNLPDGPYKVFSNIPFNMTSDIVNKLLLSKNPPSFTYLIMQDKAFGRFSGPPFGPISQMSVLLSPFFKTRLISKIKRTEFEPIPNVTAVLAVFEKKTKPDVDFLSLQEYRDFVMYGFNQWKPTLVDSFKNIFSNSQLETIRGKLNIGKNKPSEVENNQWVKLFNLFLNDVPGDKKKIVSGFEMRFKARQNGMIKLNRTR